MYIQRQLKKQMKAIDDDWGGVSDDELLTELYEWLKEEYPLIYLNEYDLEIYTDIHPITIEDTYDCIVSKSIISQCKVSYPEALL